MSEESPTPRLSSTPGRIGDMTNEAAVGLPALQSSRRTVWNYYRIEFLPDGYPGRRTGDKLHAHPIYGPYVISDYLAQFRQTRDQEFLTAAQRVADATVRRMTPMGASLVFMYDQEQTKVSSKRGSWYSGLTQARYVEVFSKLLRFPGSERFQEPLNAILASLERPVSDDGVAWETEGGGLIIEEYPSVAPDCTLNGWTTATCILRDYARTHADDRAWSLFHQSVRGLEAMVPIYDVPQYATSRYRLKGSAVMQLLPSGSDITVRSVQIRMPGTGVHDANSGLDPAGSALPRGARSIRSGAKGSFTISLSRCTFPRMNTVLFTIEATSAGTVQARIGDGAYDPMKTRLLPTSENYLGTFSVESGTSVLEVPVPWTDAEIIAYPTDFRKGIAGRQFNQYHWIHVDTLGKIAEETGSELLRYYGDRWRQYPKHWPAIPEYQDNRITLERFDPQRHR